MTNDLQNNYRQSAEWLEKAENIVLVPHYNPDGDAIGSCLALHNLLLLKEKKSIAISPNEFPEFLSWMPGSESIYLYNRDKQIADQHILAADLIIMVDFSSKRRLNHLEDAILGASAKKINIDHHPEPDQLADILFSDTSVSSTAELIYRFIEGTNNLSYLNKDIASCIFCGIMTDTGCFSHNSSTPETYDVVSQLLRQGINKDFIFAKVFQDYSEQRMKMLGFALSKKMVVVPELHTAYLSLTKAEMDLYNHQLGDTEGFVNIPFSIRGIICTALFLEKEDHIKISLRSRGKYSVNDLARAIYIGGGHRNAAGATAYLSLDESIQVFIQKLKSDQSELQAVAKEVELIDEL